MSTAQILVTGAGVALDLQDGLLSATITTVEEPTDTATRTIQDFVRSHRGPLN